MNEEPQKPVFDIAVTRRLLNTASSYGRLPGAEFVSKLAEQLRAALDDIDGAQGRVDRAQTDMIRCQRELEAANVEMRLMRQELISLRSKPPEPVAPVVAEAPAAAPPKPRKKPGPKPRGKLVAMPDVQQKAAQ